MILAGISALVPGMAMPAAALAGVPVGKSDLMGSPDYADTFTVGPNGRAEGSAATGDSLVETANGTPPTVWMASKNSFSFNSGHNLDVVAPASPNPGDSGAGSATGILQQGGPFGRAGICYNDTGAGWGKPLRDHFVVQADLVLNDNVVWIGVGTRPSLSPTVDSHGLAVLFRAEDGQFASSGISLLRPGVGEVKIADCVPGVTKDAWANLAVEFAPDSLKVYVNEKLVAKVPDLRKVDGKDFSGYGHSMIGMGWVPASEDAAKPEGDVRFWADNFQVGPAKGDPAPAFANAPSFGDPFHGKLRFSIGDLPMPELRPVSRSPFPMYQSSVPFQDGRIELTVAPKQDGRWFGGVRYIGSGEARFHLRVETPIVFTDASYTLIPAAYYNGNAFEITPPGVAAMRAEQGWKYAVQSLVAATPVALHFDGVSQAHALAGSPVCTAGPSGFLVDKNRGVMGMSFPCEQPGREPAKLSGGQVLCFDFRYSEAAAKSVPGLFRLYNAQFRNVPDYTAPTAPKVPLAEAAQTVADFVMDRHSVLHDGKYPLFLNAFDDVSGNTYGEPGFEPTWMQLNGWASGPMTCYPLLKLGGRYREAAVRNLDFLVSTSLSPSGLARALFNGRNWSVDNSMGWGLAHNRMTGDFTYNLLKCYRVERDAGTEHAAWKEAAQRGLDAFCSIWERDGQFGQHVNKELPVPEILLKGSAAGAFVMQALAEGMAVFPDNPRYRKVFLEAADYYHREYVAKGHCTGGPLDIQQADDSESAMAMTDALVLGYQVLKEPRLLAYAEDAAQIFATWVASYAAPFPPGSPLFGYNARGGVIANTQNRHIGPGPCTNSVRALHDLSELTGNPFYENIYQDVIAAAVNFSAMQDGEWLALGGSWYPFQKGQVTEQVNVTDALNQSGNMWPVSASWPATSILLMWAESPPGK